MTGSARRVAVCIGRKKPTMRGDRDGVLRQPVLATGRRSVTSIPASRSHAAGDASPNGWRPMS